MKVQDARSSSRDWSQVKKDVSAKIWSSIRQDMGTKFSGQVAIVTGAASGLGLAIAKKLHAEGGHVALLDLNDAALQTAANEVGNNAAAFAIDLTKQDQVENVVGQIAERF